MSFLQKTRVRVDLPPKIHLNKPFKCPECGMEIVITDDMIFNRYNSVPTTCALYAERKKIIEKSEKNPPKYDNYVDCEFLLIRNEHKMIAMGDHLETSASTSIELACEHKVPITITCDMEIPKEPEKVEMLHRLGLNTPKSWRWLSYLWTGQVNEKAGKKRAEEIMSTVDNFYKEKQAWADFQKEIKEKIPASITGLEARISGEISKNVMLILDELSIAVQSIISEIDTALVRIARRPEGRLTARGWVAVGET